MRIFRKTLSEEKRQARVKNRRVHMANERTFLAWIRTCLGIFLVFLGAAASLLATYRFRKTERQIMEDTYHPSIVADMLVAVLLASIGILMVIYLIYGL